MYDTWRMVFIGGAVLGAILFFVSMILFFALRIPNVIGSLSGVTARREIRNIRAQNEKTAKMKLENITDKIPTTASCRDFDSGRTEIVLAEAVLGANSMGHETMVLEMDAESVSAFQVEREITYIFSNEVIF